MNQRYTGYREEGWKWALPIILIILLAGAGYYVMQNPFNNGNATIELKLGN